jgi:hypothetical protein
VHRPRETPLGLELSSSDHAENQPLDGTEHLARADPQPPWPGVARRARSRRPERSLAGSCRAALADAR